MNKRIIAFMVVCLSVFMVHAQTAMYPGMAIVRNGHTMYVTDVLAGSPEYDANAGKLLVAEDDAYILTYVSHTDPGGEYVLVTTYMVCDAQAMSWALSALGMRSNGHKTPVKVSYAEDVYPTESHTTYYTGCYRTERLPQGLVMLEVTELLRWEHSTLVLWNAGGKLCYSGPVNSFN